MAVVVESRDLVALIAEPHLRTTGDKNSPLMQSAQKVASFAPDSLSYESAYRYFTRLRGSGDGPDMHFVDARRADETVLALLGEDAAHALRSLPHFFDHASDARAAAVAHYADDENATAADVKRLARSLWNFTKGWKQEMVETYGRSKDAQRATLRKQEQGSRPQASPEVRERQNAKRRERRARERGAVTA